MRKFATFIGMLLPFSAGLAADAESTPPPRPVNGGSDVTLVLVVAANFYCDNSRWPDNIDEVLYYREKAKIRPDLKISEQWLRSTEVRITTAPIFRVRARDYIKDKPVIVEATELVPLCEKGAVTVKGANMHIGADGEL
jgi:hypothetical protein